MKKLVLVFAACRRSPRLAANAGGWATVGLSSLPPTGLKAGQPWPVDITVLQHGRTPLAGVAPVLRIRETTARSSRRSPRHLPERPASTTPSSRSPRSGTYSYEVYDGFATYGGAQTTPSRP